MGADLLVDPCMSGEASDDPGGVVSYHAVPVVNEDRTFLTVAYGLVDGSGSSRRHGNESGRSALPRDSEGVMSSLQPIIINISTQSFGHT